MAHPTDRAPTPARPAHPPRVPEPVRVLLLLAPALAVVVVVFLGGLAEGVLQSLGRQPYLGASDLSTAAYQELWSDPAVRASVLLTLRVALLSTLAATVLGVACALLVRSTRRGRRATTVLLQTSLPVPHIVGALCMLLLLSQSGLLSRLTHAAGLTATPADFPPLTADAFGWAILAEYVWKEAPFVAVVVLAALAGVRELEDAARTLGAGWWQRLRLVVLPVIAPAVLATSVLVLAFSFGSYEVPYLLGRPFPATLPVVAYQYYRDSDLELRPEAMALCVVIAVAAGLLVVAYAALTGRVLRRVP